VPEGATMSVDEFAPNDEIPGTLVDVMRQLAIDFVPETISAADCINRWLDVQEDLPVGTPLDRGVGVASFDVEGRAINALAQPYRFYLLNRMHVDFDTLAPADKRQVEKMLEQCNLRPVVDARLTRGIGREDNREVWL